ncbi:MAG: TonB-dependent receptor, partial [Gemmatimonadetes bacterium]|nr:TonB-dependent receptor [Gemmatimonadota bacterium]
MTTRLLALMGPACAAIPLTAPFALAQTEEGDTVTLAPVVVSVLRSPVPLDRLPFAASVMAGPDLAEGTAGLFIEEALHALPGVRVQNRYNASVGERISIRGFGARSQFGVRGIKIFVDGIPATLPDGQTTLDHLDVGSLGRVEALRGPAAALYGNGAGGVILFRSAAPYHGGYRQEATVVAGSDGLLRLQATGSGSAGSVGFRASVARNVFDGFRNNASDSGEDPYSRAERTTLNAGLTSAAGGGTLTLQLSGLDLDALNPGSLPAELFDEGSNQAWGFNVARKTRKDVRQGQAGVSWSGPLGGLEGVFSAYGVRRELDNPIPTRVIDLKRNGGGVRAALGKEWGGD